MNKRMKKKACTYKPLSNKQRLKNQARAIRQLYKENEQLSTENKSLKHALEIEKNYSYDLMQHKKQLENNLKEQPKKSFWKKVFK
ncbi:hypothetical protein [Zhenhengia yiwuensis]|uniref:Uncharacterized protein n=1 Tax=Zhenhengia yiwuensis TaxID=2763666 RepID=A0A926EKU5_9FIRM|nr:hypothetical protein [Zhenhengia yiwuensis]MBC8579947.1 hypothetical protein [Zhenhengia yiwuensis]